MAFQEFELNMIPHGDMPSFYASQYETGRPIIIDIMMGEDAFDCSELYIELHARKVDDNIVTLEPDSVDGNQVTFIGTDQLFACPGQNLAEICLYADETKDTSLGSLNFFIEVEPDPLAGGLESETQIHNLYQQVEEITQQVIGDDYYDKTEVDDLLDDKADKSDTYTKSQVDTALNLKADKSTTYTKTQVDSALALKADKSTTYTKTQVDNALALKANSADLATVATTGDYDDLTNKPTIPAAQVQSDWSQSDNTQVDYIKNKPDLSVYVTSDNLSEIIYDLLPAGTASGAIANFDTDLSLPLVDCKANIVASQPSGTPTPSSPLAISGYTGMNLTRCGVNLFDVDKWLTSLGVPYTKTGDTYSLTTSSTTYNNPFVISKTDIPITLSVKSITGTATNVRLQILNSSNTVVESCYANETKTATGCKVCINYSTSGTAEIEKPQIVLGSTPVEYTAYNGTTYPVSWQDEAGTVYGGNLDLTTGVLTVTHKYKALGTISWIAISGDRWETTDLVSDILKPASNSGVIPLICSILVATSTNNLFVNSDVIGIAVPTNGRLQCRTGDTVNTPTGDLVYPLETPVTYQLTPVQVQALLGVNNVFNDTNGDTEVRYKDSIQHYIDSRV